MARKLLEELQGLARAESANASYWLTVGRLHATLGQFVDARGCYRVASELNSGSPWPHYHAGLACLETKDYFSADREFSKVINLDDSISEAFMNRAIARVQQRKFADAIGDLNRIENDAERLPRLYFVRETARRSMGDSSGANQDLEAGLKLMPNDAASWNARGEGWLRTNPPQPERALSDFRSAVECEPGFRIGFENQSQVLSEHLRKPAEAIQALDRALEIDPEYALALSSRAVLLARLGKRAEARRDAEAALKIDPAPLHCYQAACVCLLTSESAADRHKAIALLRRALRTDISWAQYMPSDPDLRALRQTAEFAALMKAAQELSKTE
jgi:tetratricopeptide (TPR) repeat protein